MAQKSRDSRPRNGKARQSYMSASLVSPNSTVSTIALFGAGSKTGTHFLRSALDAGYQVRALLLDKKDSRSIGISKSLKEEFADQDSLHWIRTDTVYSEEACRRVLRGADYVVYMMNDAPLTCDDLHDETTKNKRTGVALKKNSNDTERAKDPRKPLTSFLQLLYPLMKKEESIQVFLHQASSLSADVKGNTPMFSKVLKSVSAAGGVVASAVPGFKQSERSLALQDQDASVREIALHHRRSKRGTKENAPVERARFAYIVTRPATFLKEAPSCKKISASKSQPGPFPIPYVDLAEFSLNALLNESLYNSCPYIVADSF